MRAHFGLPSVEAEDKEGKPPISVKFEIPYFTTSGIQVHAARVARAPEQTWTGPGGPHRDRDQVSVQAQRVAGDRHQCNQLEKGAYWLVPGLRGAPGSACLRGQSGPNGKRPTVVYPDLTCA